ASIMASVTSLLDAGVDFAPTDHRELLETIHHEAARLNRLIANFLDLSRMRAGVLVANRSPGGIDEIVEAVLARMRETLRGHNVRLILREDLPDVPMDMVQIDQLLTNVIENAAKFSPPGTDIHITASRWRDAVRVRITDQGPGIPPSQRERVFEPFIGDRTGNGTGSGLGLSIAHAIVTSHGGRIWLETAPGGGTAVSFDLPMTK
ncbi:MAG: hypothetical protein H0U16_00425, partial [Actinobacteria bacterium]|nr:hypothetical protein [Actinomycetota bacterium]